jgi:indole-3-glycerol phosphate synthase
VSDTLARIVAYKRDDVAARMRATPFSDIEAIARAQTPPRGFADALRAGADRPALIAEIKKASPSKGLIREDFHVPALARAYAEGGAACLSVLTDEPSFQGHDSFLVAARGAVSLPALRKDFMVHPWQVVESRALGADAVLIIMAAVDDALAHDLADAARAYGMDALVEVHDEAELDRALALDAPMLGVNNRDLKTFATDLAVTERLAPRAPRDRLLVAESGIATRADIDRLSHAGARAFLVGESLMRQSDVANATRALLAIS